MRGTMVTRLPVHSNRSMSAPVPDLSALIQRLQQASRVLLIAHVSPDSDAIGSLLGMAHALRALGKAVTPACADDIRDRFPRHRSFQAELRTAVERMEHSKRP